MNLDVVIITKNQGWNAGRIVESVLDELTSIPGARVMLVDSASTDDTVNIACQYPIRIIRLSKRQRLTAAAGRQAGITQTSADIVLFLDGDMELCPGWIRAAMAVFQQEPDVAVISGDVIDQPRDFVGRSNCRPLAHLHQLAYDDVAHGGGAAAYRRSVLEQVGSFNPYLFSDEEPELCLRIRKSGYRIVKLRMPIANHFSDPAGAISTLLGRRSRNLYLGPGQALRLHARTPLLTAYARERGFGLFPGLGIAVGLVSMSLTAFNRDPRWLLGWTAGIVAMFGLDSMRKGSVSRALFSMVQRLLFAEGTIRGFMMRPNDPSKFPYMIEVIK